MSQLFQVHSDYLWRWRRGLTGPFQEVLELQAVAEEVGPQDNLRLGSVLEMES